MDMILVKAVPDKQGRPKAAKELTEAEKQLIEERTKARDPKRKGAPLAGQLTRGSKRLAMAGASDDGIFEQAMSRYIEDWTSAGDTSEYYWTTWVDIHSCHWDGLRRERLPPLPLTAIKFHTIGSLLKLGGYRSADNYATIAKRKHVESGYQWSAELELASKRMVTSCQRGMGPPRQSEPLNYEAILLLDLPADPLIDGGPLNTKALAVMATMFLTREVEVAMAERSHVVADHEEKTISWLLPVSKTDYKALGCRRSWGCSCTSSSSTGCVYHTMSDHLNFLSGRFGPPCP